MRRSNLSSRASFLSLGCRPTPVLFCSSFFLSSLSRHGGIYQEAVGRSAHLRGGFGGRALLHSVASLRCYGASTPQASSSNFADPSNGENAASVASSTPAGDDGALAHITHNLIWGLWNEGNLFSLSVPELRYFLTTHCQVEGVDPQSKKSALVRQVEEILAAEQASNIAVQQEDVQSDGTVVTIADYDKGEEALDEADEYGDWGAEPGFEQRRHADYVEVAPTKLGPAYDPLVPRSFQLLHSQVSSDVQLHHIDPSKLPGQSKNNAALTVRRVEVDESNRQRFRKVFEWCLANIWNMNVSGELNIGAGKVLYYRQVAKQNRNVLPIWTLQRHLYTHHPYVWFAVASESNTAAMEALATTLGLELAQDTTCSYKTIIRRNGELLDAELNAQLQCVKFNRPWDRLLVTHYVRGRMPDLRLLVRVRHPIRRRVVETYLETDILRATRDTVHSVLSPELGDVVYCCERQIRKWERRTRCGVLLQLVETRRTPLIITRVGDEGMRLEYEWVVQLPQRAEKVDVAALSDELWDYGNTMARALEEGMEDLMAHAMPTAASFFQ
ncbi:unnamed protein product [Phytomonas sp. EM1]|nr:unnamed protein product [Phytomonas sp. EM1]|eukprot:CCW63676.1 unnamed protein product [Phytomonas sp. isolate EM1]